MIFQARGSNYEGDDIGKTKGEFIRKFGFSWDFVGADYTHTFTAESGRLFGSNHANDSYEISVGIAIGKIAWRWGKHGRGLYYGLGLGGILGGGVGVDIETWDGRFIKF